MATEDKWEDTIKYLRDRGYKVIEEYSHPGQLSKVSGEHPQRKTWWGWLRLLGAFALLIGVAFILIAYSHDLQIAREQHLSDLQISTDQHEQATLETYLDRMSDLLLKDKLLESKPGDEVRALARARTLTALRELNPDRKRILLGFLYEANLISVRNVIVDLSFADLSHANLSGADLDEADLRYANLQGANLSFANLHDADLGGTSLAKAILSNAFLIGAYLGRADLSFANLDRTTVTNAQLTLAISLQGAIMPDGSRHP
jgi:uncharacterized protein YjbI with pentapeptide repeats